jgi:hypothetical protein
VVLGGNHHRVISIGSVVGGRGRRKAMSAEIEVQI